MEEQAKFEGWAIVEIMGHQRHAGYCETQTFGGTVMLRVTSPEVPPFEQVMARRQIVDGEVAPVGSRVQCSRPKLEVMVGMSSIYRITPCTEEQALSSIPFKRVITFRPEILELPPVCATVERIGEEGDQGDGDDYPF